MLQKSTHDIMDHGCARRASAWALISGLVLPAIGLAQPLPERIVFGSDHDYAPFEYLDNEGDPAGFNVDLIRAIGRSLDIEVDVRLGPWPAIREELEPRGTVDISDMFYSASRAEKVNFATPYTRMHDSFFVRQGSPMHCSIDDLDGRNVIVQQSSYTHDYLIRHAPKAHLYTVASEPDALRLLAAGAHDCALVSAMVGAHAITVYHLGNLVSHGQPVLPRDYGFVTRKDRPELVALINRGLAQVRESGEYTRLYNRWFDVAATQDLVQAPVIRNLMYGLVALSIVMCVTLLWSWSMRRLVALRTQQLQKALAESSSNQDSLRESEARFRQLTDHINEVFWLADMVENRVLYVSPAYESIWGLRAEDLYNDVSAWQKTIHPEDRENAARNYDTGRHRPPAAGRAHRPYGGIERLARTWDWRQSVGRSYRNRGNERPRARISPCPGPGDGVLCKTRLRRRGRPVHRGGHRPPMHDQTSALEITPGPPNAV